MYRAAITGVAGFLPDDRLTNADLERIVETNDEWIRTRTGIEERRILKDPDKASLYMAGQAARELLRKTDTRPEEIDLTIVATVTPEHIFPDTATLLNHEIGAVNAYGFELSAACSGFLYGLTVAAQMVASGLHQRVMLVGVDKMSTIVDYEDRTTCIIFGDGAGAVLFERDEEHGLIDTYLRGDGSGYEYLHMKAGGSRYPASAETVAKREHYAYQEGRTVFKRAVLEMADAVRRIMDRNQLDRDSLDWLVPHQANLRILNSVASQLDLPLEKVMVNIQKYGNTTAATLPLCLRDWESQLHRGDHLILTAFGGGFTWGASYFRWAYDS